MKTKISFLSLYIWLPLVWAGSPPPPVVLAPAPVVTPAPAPVPVYNYEQKPLAGRQPLITPENAQGIIDKFKAAYPKLGSPRFVIYVNRELVDENSGLKLTARNEKVDTTRQAAGAPNAGGKESIAAENRYSRTERKEPVLADRQTMRDVERLFGRPLRFAGASLSDQRLATQLMADKPLRSLGTQGDQARKDREALAQIADVAVEVLISSKSVTVPEVAGDRTYALPDIQATAIQLKDAKILGQASSSDAMRGNPAYYARNFDVRDITETTALALMEDMLTSGPSAPQAATKQ